MRNIQTEAIVIHRTNYGEADRILQLITPELGKVGAIAKGVRKEKSKLAGGIELFAICNLTLVRGRGELYMITSSRLANYYGTIVRDYEKLQLGYAMLQQINRASETVADEPEFYDLLATALAALGEDDMPRLLVYVWFYLQLAILLGVGVNLATDHKGKKLSVEKRYDFDPREMTFYDTEKGTFDANHIKLLRVISSQRPRVVRQVKDIGPMLVDLEIVARGVADSFGH